MKRIVSILVLTGIALQLLACSRRGASAAGFEATMAVPVSSPSSSLVENESELPSEPPEEVTADIQQRDPRDLDAALENIAKQNNVAGCTVAVFEGEDIFYTWSYGTASRRGGVAVPASDDTKYRAASISKMVSAMLVMRQVERGGISLDDTLDKLIDSRLYDKSWPNDRPTVRQLLSHTSGIVDSGIYNQAISNVPYPKLETVLSWGNTFSGNKPGAKYSYSNFGMGLAAAIVEKSCGESFADYAYNDLMKPLGLDAGYLTDYISDPSTIASLGAVDPVSWGNMKRYYSNIPVGQMYLLAQGELYISARDLAKILMVMAGGGTLGDFEYLKAETVAEMQTPLVYDKETNTTRGLAIQIADDIVEGVTLYGHQGNAYGAISCAFYDPVTTRGVVFLSNGASGARAANYVYNVNHEVVNEVWGWLLCRQAKP